MLYEILRHLHNFFLSGIDYYGEVEIKDGNISLPFLKNNAYFLITGSLLNDGVYKYPAELKDEKCVCKVCLLALPNEFIKLVEEIEEFEAKNEASAFTSESFGGYSYSKAMASDGSIASWRDVFKKRLNVWRKI